MDLFLNSLENAISSLEYNHSNVPIIEYQQNHTQQYNIGKVLVKLEITSNSLRLSFKYKKCYGLNNFYFQQVINIIVRTNKFARQFPIDGYQISFVVIETQYKHNKDKLLHFFNKMINLQQSYDINLIDKQIIQSLITEDNQTQRIVQ
ncbi:Actin-related protein 2/3 complex subunit [Spironucleus salmonicida]|uniref:Actin-related protein 2/3 complex subunit n=1 Tax=Spironucleus salmonicida TaxID=348837 RepID=V6LMJ6_9EUKA|nr:Actin-related protein 2/3 complex subunit [Spironucleus salmonicida]|eukprot:EST44931.1 Actin-related protein 2/3 complex subunit [Spironucleus salmonicida]